ncbi:uncharacterized protein SPPG_05261 [Spizellomyces punctatus DAOM BR117]|uniref:Uncharacterized protein n=1 Tax=Spizellomyces punctatus (strain DAOM BR117) TaxID=645134 RepID=A0A0L0HGD1_SPIPD|nr:uncharacterized protein SPPG_05261 [Spizellomyces punctatus DAOM BR117]KNC99888.1 hypothetical protein SPPG_05261 [Spizellomyces punctatus DAOM BR117]|eukprot:XP_016607928.1 hypothetical protein SPPG_05261 [Spizellomyces punctatus DAOM BR117]
MFKIVLTTLALTVLTGANAQDNDLGALPAAILPPAGYVPKEKLYAVGTQNYVCSAGAATPWTLVTPKATLYKEEAHTTEVAKHFFTTPDATGAKVIWEDVNGSGSHVRAAPNATSPSPDGPQNVPWVILKATESTGELFGNIGYVLRIHTLGGVAPNATECTAAKNGTEVDVDYTALYVFYTNKGATNTPETPATTSQPVEATKTPVPTGPLSDATRSTVTMAMSVVLSAVGSAIFWL